MRLHSSAVYANERGSETFLPTAAANTGTWFRPAVFLSEGFRSSGPRSELQSRERGMHNPPGSRAFHPGFPPAFQSATAIVLAGNEIAGSKCCFIRLIVAYWERRPLKPENDSAAGVLPAVLGSVNNDSHGGCPTVFEFALPRFPQRSR